MNSFLREQLQFALELWAIFFCFTSAVFTFIHRRTGFKKRKSILLAIELINALLLISDLTLFMFNGDTSPHALIILRISVFILSLSSHLLMIAISLYILDLAPRAVGATQAVQAVSAVGIILVIISAFTKFYYYFDAQNVYHRTGKFWISQVIGLIAIAIEIYILIKHRKTIGTRNFTPLMTYFLLPIIALIMQMIYNKLELLNISITVAVFFLFVTFQLEMAKFSAEQERNLGIMRTEIMLSQIKPHFMFNALSTIKYLCHSDPKKAEEAVDEFSAYLRISLESMNENRCIPLENEIHHIENYVALEKKRFGERVNFEMNLVDDDISIPALSLQPLVENAIKHGITKKIEGGTVSVTTERKGDVFEIKVTDNGVGFDSGKPNANDGRKHIGIQNVRERLKSMCQGELEIKSKIGEGTTSIIRIPVNRRK